MNFTRVALTSAAAALLVPAAAHAATLETDLPCYLTGQSMGVRGTGWGPGTGWSVRADGIFAQGTADPTGTWVDTSQVKAPAIDAGTTKPTTVTLTAQQDGTDVASTTFQVVNFAVKPKDDSGKPTGKTKWSFSGFEPGKTVYIHVTRKGRTYTQRVGTAKSPCGTLSKRLRRLPAVPSTKIGYGRYKVAVDTNKAYQKSDGSFNQYTATITIRKKYL